MADDGQHLSEDLAGDALGAVLPVIGGTLGTRAMRSVRREWERLTSKALHAAEKTTGMSREDLVEWVGSEPRAMPLYMKVLLAAGMNGHDETLQAMGAVFGQAAKAAARDDDDAFEDAALALGAMAYLGARHFRVLHAMNASRVLITEGTGLVDYSEFTPGHIAVQAGLRKNIAEQCLLNLAAAGLATTTPVLDGIAYPITELGRAVVQAVEAVSGEPESSPA